jgi:hypothetical protein
LSGYVVGTTNPPVNESVTNETTTSSGNNEYRVEIDDMHFYVKRRHLETDLFNSIKKKFSMGKKAMYPITQTMMRTEHISKGCYDYINGNLFTGVLPEMMCIGIVSSDAYNGLINKSPFNFKSNNLIKLIITIDGQSVLYQTLECNFKKGEYLLAYNTLFGGKETKYGNGISMAEYLKGNTLFVYDFRSTKPKQLHGERKGTVGIEICFSDPLEEHQRIIIMTTSQQVIEIDKDGRVEVVY